jgi:hypothetical protein
MSKRKRAPFEFHQLKIDPKPSQLPDFVATSSEPADFMRGDAGIGTDNIGPDDVVWMVPGAGGELEVPLPKLGYEQYSPFDLVLLAIVRARPKEGKGRAPDTNEYERLRQARTALFGEPGLDLGLTRADDEILLRVGRQVFEDIVAHKGGEVELAPLIRKFAAPHYKQEELARSVEAENPTVRRLSAYFDKHRDEYLARVTTPDYYAQARIDRIIDEILDRLESLGVSVGRGSQPRR